MILCILYSVRNTSPSILLPSSSWFSLRSLTQPLIRSALRYIAFSTTLSTYPSTPFFHVASRIGARQVRFAFFIRRFPKLLRLNPTSVVSFHSIDPEKSWSEPAISTISSAKSWNWYPKFPRFSRLFSK